MNRALALTTLALASTCVALAPLGCGPSVQLIYEGNVRFEHCYRLDLDLAIAPTHREACWRQWLKSYTYGQPRDRTEYARKRIRAFMAGDVSRPTLKLSTEPRPEDRQFYLVVPNPTSLHAPPPPIATRMYADERSAPPVAAPAASVPSAAGASTSPTAPPAPAARCATDCSRSWQSCQAACAPDGGSSDTACRSCEPDYKACMKRCFE